MMCLHMNLKAYMVCNFNCPIETEVQKVISSHVHCKTGNIWILDNSAR